MPVGEPIGPGGRKVGGVAMEGCRRWRAWYDIARQRGAKAELVLAPFKNPFQVRNFFLSLKDEFPIDCIKACQILPKLPVRLQLRLTSALYSWHSFLCFKLSDRILISGYFDINAIFYLTC